MSRNVKLPYDLVAEAKRFARVYHRSLSKQSEYWARIGKIAEENQDLPCSLIKDILLVREEEGFDEYEFG